MARLNMMKMIGLIILLGIALTLPSVLPRADIVLHDQSFEKINHPISTL